MLANFMHVWKGLNWPLCVGPYTWQHHATDRGSDGCRQSQVRQCGKCCQLFNTIQSQSVVITLRFSSITRHNWQVRTYLWVLRKVENTEWDCCCHSLLYSGFYKFHRIGVKNAPTLNAKWQPWNCTRKNDDRANFKSAGEGAAAASNCPTI